VFEASGSVGWYLLRVESGDGAVQVMEGEEEEEVAMVGNTMGDYRNVKCPLSGVDIHDLKDPVWDQEQIIYEREAIEVRPSFYPPLPSALHWHWRYVRCVYERRQKISTHHPW